MQNVADSRKQEIMDQIMIAKRDALLMKLEDENTPEPKEPSLAFELVEPSGKFSILFDISLTGLDFVTELGVEIKSDGVVSDAFADD